MSLRLPALSAAGIALTLVLAQSCKPVEGTPVPVGPENLCGAGILDCSTYSIGATSGGTKPTCTKASDGMNRCDYGVPTFAYTIVVNAPNSSVYAAGRVFTITSNDLSATTPVATSSLCSLPSCVQLVDLVTLQGQYTISPDAAAIMGLGINSTVSIPVQTTLIPFGPGTTTEALALGLPLDTLITSSLLLKANTASTAQVTWTDAVALGDYLRIMYPEPPFDAYVPPSFASPLSVTDSQNDDVELESADEVSQVLLEKPPPTLIPVSLDDETGDSRRTTITRRDGLDGFQVWIADHPTQRRISTIKTLSGTSDTEVLHTLGFRQAAAPALVDDVDIIISPPQTWLAVPKLVSPIINGSAIGFRNIDFPVLPSPVTFSGVVGAPTPDVDAALTGVPSSIAFTSSALLRTSTASETLTADTTLQYATVVSTDNAGRFTTVLPPGTYDVVVEPIEGTGFAKFRTTVDTTAGLSRTLQPPGRTIVTGRAILADGRPLSQATVRAMPAAGVTLGATEVTPRATLARTETDGTFRFEADQGQYNLMIDPELGTYFPRVVQAVTIAGATFGTADVVVPPGARLPLTIRDPSSVAVPIANALVRVYAELGRGPPAVEIASASTDSSGFVEIWVAPQTR